MGEDTPMAWLVKYAWRYCSRDSWRLDTKKTAAYSWHGIVPVDN